MLYKDYANNFKEQLKDDIIEMIDINSKTSNHIYYMPHHPVVRNDKETTKLRIVYDASAKEENCLSLNDNLHAGPNLNPNIFTLLLKFRKHKIGITADIEKAFLQISLAEEDRDCQRFLWLQKIDANEIKCFKNKTVTFGIKSSPFLLAATIKHHLKGYEKKYPLAYTALNEQLYVDDLIFSIDRIEDAIEVSKNSKLVLMEAGMNLRKWKSNSNEISELYGEKKLENQTSVNDVPIKVLGIIWNTISDEFKLDVLPLIESLQTSKNTKRSVLKISCKLFDPLGIISAFTIRVKILLQEIWEKGVGWDENLPEDLKIKWKTWCTEVPDLEKLSIPRCYIQDNFKYELSNWQLHIFCDASEAAYGAIAYIRFEKENGKFDVSFITSKARVSPLKKLSLPRLELMATLIGARLLNTLKDAFEFGNKYMLWSDSKVALSWIKGKASRWKPFVCNRVIEIQKLTNPQNWKHCKGLDNPSDVISRGCSADNLLKDTKLWTGPKWLVLPEDQWPHEEAISSQEIIIEERKQKITVNLIHEKIAMNNEPPLCLNNYSTISKVYRITAWIRRFQYNSKSRKEDRIVSPTLTAEEIEEAEEIWIKIVQTENFPLEITNLREGKIIPKNSKIRDLNPLLDEKGLLLVGGRLHQANLTFQEKHPIILPSKTRFAELIVRQAHEIVLHSGVTNTLIQVREKFWLIQGRQFVKSILRKCTICKRFNVRPGSQITAPLPKDRIVSSPVFSVTGIDFAGPLFVKNSENKFYILICTCAVTRAVHFELVSNLTTEVFLLAFRRFVSRRGLCSVIYSDNAKTFKCAELELKRIWEIINHRDIKEFFSSHGIRWKYIIERGAWWGGFYERMVRSMKTILRKTLRKTSLTAEELETVLTEIEAVINSRPLTYVSSDVNEPFPLTPAHLLIGRRLTSLPAVRLTYGDCISSKKVLLKKFNYRERLLDHFWKIWKKDYLLNLKSANSVKCNESNSFHVNDIVLVNEEHLPRNLWRLGKVIETFPGRDGKIRSCTVKTEKSVIKRPIQLLYNLEVQD